MATSKSLTPATGSTGEPVQNPPPLIKLRSVVLHLCPFLPWASSPLARRLFCLLSVRLHRFRHQFRVPPKPVGVALDFDQNGVVEQSVQQGRWRQFPVVWQGGAPSKAGISPCQGRDIALSRTLKRYKRTAGTLHGGCHFLQQRWVVTGHGSDASAQSPSKSTSSSFCKLSDHLPRT